jgi:hypothetical protein
VIPLHIVFSFIPEYVATSVVENPTGKDPFDPDRQADTSRKVSEWQTKYQVVIMRNKRLYKK